MVDSTEFESRSNRSFYADSLAVIFREDRIFLDFKKTSPRLDSFGGNKKQTVLSEHNPVIVSPRKAKMFKNLLEKNIERYEDKFGEIDVSKDESPEEEPEEDTADYIA